jgi:hypothetical protein
VSTFSLALSAAQIAVLNGAFVRPSRSVGGLVPMVVVSEKSTDRVTVTRHPLEKGAAIADHAYKEPASVVLMYGWSNSAAGSLSLTATKATTTVAEVYAQLLKLQSEFTLIEVLTKKRVYRDMLITAVEMINDDKSENALQVVITCDQILQASTSTTQLATGAGRGSQPGITSPVTQSGAQQLRPAPLYKVAP